MKQQQKNHFKEAETQFLLNLWPSSNENIWIGIHDEHRNNNFVTVDGSDLEWEFWVEGEPTHTWDYPSTHDEDAVVMRRQYGGRWNDLPKKDEYVFACTYVIRND